MRRLLAILFRRRPATVVKPGLSAETKRRLIATGMAPVNEGRR